MDSPFSPFIGRRIGRKDLKRRQSQLPSDLIDWDAPEIPELERQKIIYEDLLKERDEFLIIESLINEEIQRVVFETHTDFLKKHHEEKFTNLEGRHNELEKRHEILTSRYKDMEENYKEVEFRVQELEAEVSCHSEQLVVKKAEAEDLKRKLESTRNRMTHYKKMAKGSVK